MKALLLSLIFALSFGLLLGATGCLCAAVAGGLAEEAEHEYEDARCSSGEPGEFTDTWCSSSVDCPERRGRIADCRNGACLYCEP